MIRLPLAIPAFVLIFRSSPAKNVISGRRWLRAQSCSRLEEERVNAAIQPYQFVVTGDHAPTVPAMRDNSDACTC